MIVTAERRTNLDNTAKRPHGRICKDADLNIEILDAQTTLRTDTYEMYLTHEAEPCSVLTALVRHALRGY